MPDHHRSARRYHRLQLALSILDLGVGIAFLVAILVTGAARAVATVAARSVPAWWLQVALVAAAMASAYILLTWPLSVVRGFWLPRRFGLLHQPFGSWLVDRVKGALLGGAFALVALQIVYALLRHWEHWWLAAAAIFVVAYALIAMVLPVWVLPLFYRVVPLADAELATRLLDLARRAGVPAVGIWVADQSRKSRTANAMLAGLGRTRRIILFDTLLREFAPDEVEAVLAHELAHHVHRDHARGLLVQGAVTLATLYLADVGLRVGVRWLGLESAADPAGLPWLALLLLVAGLLAAPLTNGISRRIERQADDFALRMTGNAAAFIGAMERLADLNLAERRPSRIEEIMLYSHPSIDRRIARARAWVT